MLIGSFVIELALSLMAEFFRSVEVPDAESITSVRYL